MLTDTFVFLEENCKSGVSIETLRAEEAEICAVDYVFREAAFFLNKFRYFLALSWRKIMTRCLDGRRAHIIGRPHPEPTSTIGCNLLCHLFEWEFQVKLSVTEIGLLKVWTWQSLTLLLFSSFTTDTLNDLRHFSVELCL